MCVIYNILDCTAVGVFSMKRDSCIVQGDSSIHVSTCFGKCWQTMYEHCCLLSCSSHGWDWLQKNIVERTPLASWVCNFKSCPRMYWDWNCWNILFCAHTGQCISWYNWWKLCIIVYVCNMPDLLDIAKWLISAASDIPYILHCATQIQA